MAAVPRELSKTKLSLFLRTQCDRELYLSLFKGKPATLAAAGIPAPLKSRPNVKLVTGAGQEFETDQYKMLVARIATHVRHAPNFTDFDLAKALPGATAPLLFIQPAITVETFRGQLLSNLGLTPAEQALIPPLAGIRPDLILLRDSLADDWAITPNGHRRRLATEDVRRALSVVDLKNVTEANASYAAEVCLYAVVLANWLVASGLDQMFYVSAELFLWTRPDLTDFDDFFAKNPTATGDILLQRLVRELQRDAVDFLQFTDAARPRAHTHQHRVRSNIVTEPHGPLNG